MGIPSYFSYIVKQHRQILKNFKNNPYKFDNLYMDCNGIIYDCLSSLKFSDKDKFENELINLTCEKIKNYIKIINPEKKILISFDGIAPVAKLNQQKNRRYKSWFENQIMQSINNDIKNKWNSASITPGTNFMEKLHNTLYKQFTNENIIISSSKDAGEGEHKIYEYIRKNPDYHKNTSTVIYGLDADLIMLTLNHLNYSKNLYLFRETPYFIKNIDESLEENGNYIIDIPEFSEKLVIEMVGIDIYEKIDFDKKFNLIQDYIFICFLLGNDFMPHFPSLNIRTNGIDILLNIYNNINKNLNNFLINNDNINWKCFRKLIEILAENEDKLIIEEYKIRKKWENIKHRKLTEEDKFKNTPLFNRKTEFFINPYEKGWEYRYYKSLFDIDIDDDRKKQICINYLSMLEWNFFYYRSDCIDWRYKYNYNYPPLFKDLLTFIPFFETTFLEKKIKNPINTYIQLAYVLPRDSLNLLPKNISDKLLNNLHQHYKLDYDFEWSFCKFFWECHVKTPELKIEDLEKLLIL
jgi:5'-3' exonuclease